MMLSRDWVINPGVLVIAAVVTIWLIAVFRPQRCGPSRAGDIECTSNHTIESGAWFVFLE